MNRLLVIFFLVVNTLVLLGKSDTIVVGGDFNYPPYSFINKHGKAVGYDIDVINALAKELNIEIIFELSKWDTALTRLQNGDIDVIASIVYSKEREKIFDFSFPLHTEYYSIFADKLAEITDFPDLKGKRAAFLKGDVSNDLFLKPMGLIDSTSVPIKSLPEAFYYISNEACDYVIAPYPLGMEVINSTSKFENIESKDFSFLPSVYCLGVKQGNSELLSILNTGIDRLSRDGSLDRIYSDWIKFRSPDDVYKQSYAKAKIVIWVLLIFAVCVFVFYLVVQIQSKQRMHRIRQTEHIYQAIFNAVTNGLILINENTEVVEINKTALRILNYEESVFGKPIEEIAHAESIPMFKTYFNKQINDNEVVLGKVKSDNLSETEVFEIVISKIERENTKGYIITYYNVTKEERIVETLNEARQKAESANKTKSTFLATVSHEIRTPLNAILGFSNLMAATDLNKKQKDYNKKIKTASDILFSLVSDVLDMTKIEAGRLELDNSPFLLKELVEKIIDVQQVKAQSKSIDIELLYSDAIPEILQGDALRLSQILLNLINNAIKFTDKGEVAIIVRQGKVLESVNGRICRIWFIVKDTGIGIPKQMQSQLFKPFTQTEHADKRRFGGTGLGLAISRSLVKLMGGDIFVESEEGKGARFSFFADFEVLDKQINLGNASNLKMDYIGLTILLVEDNEFNAEIYTEQLKSLGANVKWVSNGKSAIELLIDNNFDLILMDIELPGLSGIEITQQIKKYKRWERIPIIALSAYSMPEEREKALAAGMDAYLCKPFTQDQLVRKIKDVTALQSQQQDFYSDETSNKDIVELGFNGDEKLFKRVLERFYKYHKQTPELIESAIRKNDYSKLETIAHNLKSAAGTIGFNELSLRARQINQMLKSNKVPDVGAIHEMNEVLRQTLKQVLAKNV